MSGAIHAPGPVMSCIGVRRAYEGDYPRLGSPSLEDLAAADLIEAGMQVDRRNLEHGTECNFFNGEFVADRDGKICYITNGAREPLRQDELRKLLVETLGS